MFEVRPTLATKSQDIFASSAYIHIIPSVLKKRGYTLVIWSVNVNFNSVLREEIYFLCKFMLDYSMTHQSTPH